MKLFSRSREKVPAGCAALSEHFQTHLDHELDDETARRIVEHLEVCKACGLEYETYRSIKTSVERMRPPSPSAMARLTEFADDLCRDGSGLDDDPAD
jgi:anti-sigma factor RsiW